MFTQDWISEGQKGFENSNVADQCTYRLVLSTSLYFLPHIVPMSNLRFIYMLNLIIGIISCAGTRYI